MALSQGLVTAAVVFGVMSAADAGRGVVTKGLVVDYDFARGSLPDENGVVKDLARTGLAAAARVLERGGAERYDVRVAVLGHHFGGKADSWHDSGGRLIDHGQHVVVGWYREMKALLRRAGVDVDAHRVSNRGHTYTYESRDGRVHDLALTRNPLRMLLRGLGYSGLTGAEKRSLAWFVMTNVGVFLHLQDPRWPYAAPVRHDLERDDTCADCDSAAALQAPDVATHVRLEVRRRYDAELAFTDLEIGRLYDELARRDLLDRTWLIVTANHGQEFWEHGGFMHGGSRSEEHTSELQSH